ncbi:MAG: 3-hydroxyacyl-CoA dehydrogenase NAD-binding domain-containing protein [Chloroflexota bacterium]|nr:3-hydroxyacyl-CoA dehydrogenase NAD-binding domain-containing protein [Chloroflexota bacterium]
MIVGIVGAGTMGTGIAQVALQAGHEVVLHDVDERAIERGRQRIESGLSRLVEKGRLADAVLTTTHERLREANSLAAVADDADVVVEAALEDLALKQTIFQALDSAAPVNTLLATNTSALSVSEIADATGRPERVLGLHFFNPAPVMPLVEVVAARLTSSRALNAGLEFSEGLGKTPVVCRDAPGFIVNRVNRPFTLEALRMLEAGEAGVREIDRALTAAGYPMGPFQLMDLVGIDVNLAVATALYEAFDHAERFRPSPIQQALVAKGTLGRKTGSGFYRYDALQGPAVGQPAALEPGTATSMPELRDEEIVERIELPIVNEAYHAAGEEVASPPDIDRAMKLGANHPHGPFERARALGLRAVIEGLQRLERAHGERFRVAPALWQVANV